MKTSTILIFLFSTTMLIFIMWHNDNQLERLKEQAKINGALSYKLELSTWVEQNVPIKGIDWNHIDSTLYVNHKIDIR